MRGKSEKAKRKVCLVEGKRERKWCVRRREAFCGGEGMGRFKREAGNVEWRNNGTVEMGSRYCVVGEKGRVI